MAWLGLIVGVDVLGLELGLELGELVVLLATESGAFSRPGWAGCVTAGPGIGVTGRADCADSIPESPSRTKEESAAGLTSVASEVATKITFNYRNIIKKT